MKKLSLLLLLVLPAIAYADLIPTGNNPFYYQMGGDQDVPVAAYSGTTTIPLHVDGDVGLGYNCGLFNPKLSITNSLNAVENSFQNVEQSIVQNATAAIAEFPMYAVARADPDLYNLLHVRKELVSDTVTQLLQNTRSEEVGSGTVQSGGQECKDIKNGAVLNN